MNETKEEKKARKAREKREKLERTLQRDRDQAAKREIEEAEAAKARMRAELEEWKRQQAEQQKLKAQHQRRLLQEAADRQRQRAASSRALCSKANCGFHGGRSFPMRRSSALPRYEHFRGGTPAFRLRRAACVARLMMKSVTPGILVY